MTEFNITERTEPFTLDEVFSFIDDTNISKIDAHELKSRIVDVIQAERNKVIDEFAEQIRVHYALRQELGYSVDTYEGIIKNVFEYAEKLKGGGNDVETN